MTMPVVFFGHGNPMNAIQRNSYTDAWRALGAARPVVVAADAESEAARVVERSGCGFNIAPGRPDLLANTLDLLARDRATWKTYSTAGAAYAKAHWDKETIVARVEAALLKESGRIKP